MNDEVCLTRTISMGQGTSTRGFRDQVRERDRACIVSGQKVSKKRWEGYQASHLFPLAYLAHWNTENFGRWITTGGSDTINSVQNGILLRAHLHQLFDSYCFSINPDV